MNDRLPAALIHSINALSNKYSLVTPCLPKQTEQHPMQMRLQSILVIFGLLCFVTLIHQQAPPLTASVT